jgi:HK97 family phage prohead protease
MTTIDIGERGPELHPADLPATERSVPFRLERDRSDGLTLVGHAAVFNEWTTIDSWEGRFKERIAPGAFKKHLIEQPGSVRLQFDHGHHPFFGSMPLGNIRKLREDSKGLYVEARMSDNWFIQPIRDAIDDGSIDGMSFSFTVDADEWEGRDSELPERTITQVRLFELGPVVWPAYTQTDVGVRSLELARSLRNTDEDTRREIARMLLIANDIPEAVEVDTSDEVTTEERSDEAVEVDTSEHEHSGHYKPATRPRLSAEQRATQLAEVSGYLAPCA